MRRSDFLEPTRAPRKLTYAPVRDREMTGRRKALRRIQLSSQRVRGYRRESRVLQKQLEKSLPPRPALPEVLQSSPRRTQRSRAHDLRPRRATNLAASPPTQKHPKVQSDEG